MTKERVKRFTLVLALVLGVVAMPVAPAGAYTAIKDACEGNTSSDLCKPANSNETIGPVVQAIINTLLFAVGTVSVIMIIVGGIRYTTSNGDSSQITAAKNTIFYSVIGLIVALLSFVIVQFVVNRF